MHLTPREQEKLMVFVAAELARKRQARGVKLNYPEAVAIISAEILEAARDGKSVADVMVLGTRILRREDLMDGVPGTQDLARSEEVTRWTLQIVFEALNEERINLEGMILKPSMVIDGTRQSTSPGRCCVCMPISLR